MATFNYEVILSDGTRLNVTEPVAVKLSKHIQHPDPATNALTVAVQDEEGTQKGAVISARAIIAVLATEEAVNQAVAQTST